MKEITDEALRQCDHRQSIINKFANKEAPYYTKHMVVTKVRTYVCGFVGEPDYEEHEETILDKGLLESDLGQSDSASHKFSVQLNKIAKKNKEELAKISAEKNIIFEAVEDLRTQAVGLQHTHSEMQGVMNKLNTELNPYREKDARLTSAIAKTTSQIKELGYIETEVSNLLSVVEHVVQAYSPQMRAHLLMELFGKNDAESQEIVNAIKLYGFDVHYNNKQELSPLHLAIKNNDINLFNLVLSQDATILEEYSLISYAISQNREQMIERMFKSMDDFNYILRHAIEENDLLVLEKILHFKPELIHTKLQGHTLLQIAIENGKFDIAKQLLNIDESIANILSNDGDTALFTALKSSKAGFTELILNYGTNIVNTCMELIRSKDSIHLDKLFTFKPELHYVTQISELLISEGIFGDEVQLIDNIPME